MNPHEHELEYPWREVPALGAVTELRPGLCWVRMRLPFALDHVNLWLLDDEVDGRRGWTVVDCGLTTDETKAAWEAIFEATFGGRPLLRIVATHFHPDHLGLAHWLAVGGERRRWSAPLWMSATEWTVGRLLSQNRGDRGDEAGEFAAAHFARHGLTDADSLARLRARGAGYYAKLVPAVPPSYRRIQHGQSIAVGRRGARRVFDVIVGHGHAPEHVSLYAPSDRLLISGDMVLPRISTNVSVFEVEPEGNPLPQYLHSLDRYLQLPEDTLVLPSHGKPFLGLHRRVAQQHAHHQERLDEVLSACARPASAADVLPVLFRRELDLHQTTFALGETLAHLHALWFDGRVERRLGADGIYRFVVARPPR